MNERRLHTESTIEDGWVEHSAASALSARDVHLYELMLAHWYREASLENGKGSPHAESQRSVWRSVLKRATRADAP